MKEIIIGLIKQSCALEENDISEETKLADISLDSLSFIALIVNLESEFAIEFEDDELNIYDWENVGDITRKVEEKVNGTAKSYN